MTALKYKLNYIKIQLLQCCLADKVLGRTSRQLQGLMSGRSLPDTLIRAAADKCPWCGMGPWESDVCMQKVKGFMFDISIFIFFFYV